MMTFPKILDPRLSPLNRPHCNFLHSLKFLTFVWKKKIERLFIVSPTKYLFVSSPDVPRKMLRYAPPSLLARVQFGRTLATHVAQATSPSVTRHDWTKPEIQEIYDSPLLDLVFRAASVHRQNHDPSKIQLCTLMNIKSASHYAYPAA